MRRDRGQSQCGQSDGNYAVDKGPSLYPTIRLPKPVGAPPSPVNPDPAADVNIDTSEDQVWTLDAIDRIRIDRQVLGEFGYKWRAPPPPGLDSSTLTLTCNELIRP